MVIATILSIALFLTYVVIKNMLLGLMSTVRNTFWENFQVTAAILTAIMWGLFYYLTH